MRYTSHWEKESNNISIVAVKLVKSNIYDVKCLNRSVKIYAWLGVRYILLIWSKTNKITCLELPHRTFYELVIYADTKKLRIICFLFILEGVHYLLFFTACFLVLFILCLKCALLPCKLVNWLCFPSILLSRRPCEGLYIILRK
jgi:hypothetical protein